jgi:hypothetical protein
MLPSGRTTSNPSTVPCKLPYLNNRRPPAFVATLPPTQQDPLAPRSRGNKCPLSPRYVSAFSSMTPASTVNTPECGLKSLIEFSDWRDNTTSLNNGILPPAQLFHCHRGTYRLAQYSRLEEQLQYSPRCNISGVCLLAQLFWVVVQHFLVHGICSSNLRCRVLRHRLPEQLILLLP